MLGIQAVLAQHLQARCGWSGSANAPSCSLLLIFRMLMRQFKHRMTGTAIAAMTT